MLSKILNTTLNKMRQNKVLSKERFWLLALVVLILASQFILRPYIEYQENKEYTGLNKVTALGVGTHFNIHNKYFAADTSVVPFSDIESDAELMDQVKSIYILGSQFKVGNLENKFLDKFINDGGTLVVSIHDDLSKLAWGSRDAFYSHIFEDISPVKDFTQQEVEAVFIKEPYEFLPKGKYVFYSPFKFNDVRCRKEPITCYFRIFPTGKGKIVVFMGVPPFSNALISKGNNKNFSRELIGMTRKSLYDGFHHFMTQTSLWDLIVSFRYSIPLFIFFILAISYFLVGQPFSDDFELAESENNNLSPHDFYYDLYRSVGSEKFNFNQNKKYIINLINKKIKFKSKLDSDASLEDLSKTIINLRSKNENL